MQDNLDLFLKNFEHINGDLLNLGRAVLVFAAIILLGHFLKKMIFPRIVQLAKAKEHPNSLVIIVAVKKASTTWIFLLAVYFTMLIFPENNRYVLLIYKAIMVVAIFSVTMMLNNIAGVMIKKFSRKRSGIFQNTTLFGNVLAVIIFIIGLLVILQSLGISITPMLTALGVGGLAVALALQDTLSNFFAGFHILASRQMSPGDYIKLDSGEEGYVTDITWRNTTIRSLKNNIHVIPNSKMASTILTNYNQPQRELSIFTNVGVSYDSDLEKVEKVTIETVKEIINKFPGGVNDFEPYVRFHTFNDSSIDFKIIFRVKEYADQYPLKHELIKRLHSRYKQEGIIIPFPIRTIINSK